MDKDVPVKDIMYIHENLSHTVITDQETEQEREAHRTHFTFLWRQLCDFYLENIPLDIVKQTPTYFQYLLGTVCYLIAVGLFIYFLYINYISKVSSAYISLTTEGASCTSVPISVTQTYFADINGNWEGTSSFYYYRSPFLFGFSSFEVNGLSDYQLMMKTYLQSLNQYGEIALNNNLAIALVIWMSYVRYYSIQNPTNENFTTIGRSDLQYIELTGDPTIVFDTRYAGLALGSPNGECKLPATVNYDHANGLFAGTYDLNSFTNASTCVDVTTPFIFQEDASFNPYFSIYLDIRSFSTAMAVNLGYIDINNLLLASETYIEVTIGSVTYKLGKYFDARYPLMSSISCMRNTTTLSLHSPKVQALCFISTGSGFFLPVFNHIGNSFLTPEYCDCNNPDIGKSANCNNFYLMAGLISFGGKNNQSTGSSISVNFITTKSIRMSVTNAIELLQLYGSNYAALNRAAFPAMATSVLITMSTASTRVRTPKYIQNAFGFCKLSSNLNCSLIIFYTLDDENIVSTYQFPLTNGSCTNSFQVSNSSWEKLLNNPPTPLIQTYYKCYPSTYDSIVQSVGVASGNTYIAMVILLFLFVPAVMVFMACLRVRPTEREYQEIEKKVVLDTFATLLLRVRDRHYEAIDETSLISQITEELVKSVAYSNHQLLLEKERLRERSESESGSARYQYVDKLLSVEDENVHRGYLGRVYVHRHINRTSLNQRSFKRIASREEGTMLTTISNTEAKDDRPSSNDHRNQLFQHQFPKYHHKDIEQNHPKEDHEEVDGKETVRIRIMNLNENVEFVMEDPHWIDPFRNANFQTIAEGMLYYFSAAIRTRVHKAPPNAPLHQTDLDYSKGCLLSRQLLQMNENELLESKDPAQFVSLSECLAIHASLDMNVALSLIEKEYQDCIGYQIGDKVFTFAGLTELSLNDPIVSVSPPPHPLPPPRHSKEFLL